MIKIISKKALRLLISLFLVLECSGDALALQVMLPNITKEVKEDMPECIVPLKSSLTKEIASELSSVKTQTLRNIPPAETAAKVSFTSYNYNNNLDNAAVDAELYYEAKELEREMVMELETGKAGAGRRDIAIGRPAEKGEREIIMDRTKKIYEIKKKIMADEQLAKEARYAKKPSRYIFDPPRFMLGALGERVGLGHSYLQEQRPGLDRSYKESDGFRLVRPFGWIDGIDAIDAVGIAGRMEFIEEPFPIESLILDAQKIDVIRFGRWETMEQYRSQLLPIYTKAYGIDTYFTYGNLPKFTFTYDYRGIHHQFQTLYGFKHWNIKTYEFKIEDSRKWYPIGYVTLMPGFKYQVYDSDDARSGPWSSANDHRDVYYFDLLWAPSGTLEFYGKADACKANYQDIGWKYSPWHWGLKGEIRKKFLPWRTSATLGYGHSFEKYSPFENYFRKDETYLDISKEFTGRLKGSSRWEFIFGHIREDDNMAPTYTTFNRYEAEAKVLNVKNKLQYELVKSIFLTGGIDTATGFNFNEFDNFGLYTELEYYNAGAFRCNFGYRHTEYYHLEDELGTAYFKCFFFM